MELMRCHSGSPITWLSLAKTSRLISPLGGDSGLYQPRFPTLPSTSETRWRNLRGGVTSSYRILLWAAPESGASFGKHSSRGEMKSAGFNLVMRSAGPSSWVSISWLALGCLLWVFFVSHPGRGQDVGPTVNTGCLQLAGRVRLAGDRQGSSCWDPCLRTGKSSSKLLTK